jgi:hypothetical protein
MSSHRGFVLRRSRESATDYRAGAVTSGLTLARRPDAGARCRLASHLLGANRLGDGDERPRAESTALIGCYARSCSSGSRKPGCLFVADVCGNTRPPAKQRQIPKKCRCSSLPTLAEPRPDATTTSAPPGHLCLVGPKIPRLDQMRRHGSMSFGGPAVALAYKPPAALNAKSPASLATN